MADQSAMDIAQILFFASLLLPFHASSAAKHQSSNAGDGDTIVFTTLGRSHYEFDIFFLSTTHPPSISGEIRITDGESVNFNGYFPSPSPALISLLPDETLIQLEGSSPLHLIYVTERNGTSSIYYDLLSGDDSDSRTNRRSVLEAPSRVQIPLLSSDSDHRSGTMVNSFKDKPSLSGEFLVYVSTHENPGEPRTSWTAVYSTELRTGLTRRLTPSGIADYSPSVSPSGNWTAVASYGERGWTGEVEELSTDIYVFWTRDGTHRVKVVEHGGWPCWVDESTLYFHRRSEEDGWISVYRAILPENGPLDTESVTIQRVTPPGVHAFTPATSPNNHEFIAVATRRPGNDYRHVELFDLKEKEFIELTRLVAPESHHFNPFISPDSSRVGYHSCRGGGNGRRSPLLLLETIQTTRTDLSLFRIDGSFPSFSPAGDRIVYVKMPGVYVVKPDGSDRREVYTGMAFSTSWDPVRPGIMYSSSGPTFATERTEVDIISIDVDAADVSSSVRRLTTNGKNNAFPWPSPDGKRIVFRSGRSGHKNLYLMDAEKGETGGLWKLTEGAWTDTMCTWSPDGEWIAFASDRGNPGSGSFELFLIHPNGTGLRKLFQSGSGGRSNHPTFSPDSKSIVFTSDYAGISAEPISNPHHYQPYGDIFTVKLDGSNLRRLTHNSYEDGTPTWAPRFISPGDVVLRRKNDSSCAFDDCHWLNKNPTLKGQKSSC